MTSRDSRSDHQQDYPAEDLDEAAIGAGERLFATPWSFLKSVPSLEFLPAADRLEIAFAGRSNVGKSTLVNALTRQRQLARASNTPGRTQELNYFQRDAVPLYLVDMPGYGFAKAPKVKVDAWTALVRAYLRGRPSLVRVMVLIDARHGIKANDTEILEMLDIAAVSYRIVLTKADKLGHTALAEQIEATRQRLARHPAAYPFVIATSAESGFGLALLRAAVWQAAQR